MDGGRLLLAIGLVRSARPAGFCPACRVLTKALDARPELAKPTVAALVVLAVAGVAWTVMVRHTHSMAGMDMGLGAIESFAATWVVMMAAMMLPSAIPVVLEFAQTAGRRRGWQAAIGVLAATYLGVWLMFGVVCYALYTAAGMPWPTGPSWLVGRWRWPVSIRSARSNGRARPAAASCAPCMGRFRST